ncbi:MAG TPA: ABC transporter permease, partial [Candidatus Omnitrophota bacterium]|nr:ABC transporter permease [Candidatus Omnitrophota bacterium]
KVTVYLPDNNLKKGYFALFKEIFFELKDNGWLTYQLFKRDFFASYKQSFVGFFWVFILPLISVLTFVLLKRAGVFTTGDISVPYPVFAISSMAFWQIFSAGIIASANSFVKAGDMIIKINFSRKSLVIASVAQAIIGFFVQLLLIGGLLVFYKMKVGVGLFLLPFVIIPSILFTLGLGFIFSILNGVIRDVANILSIGVTFLMFLTPVLYTKPDSGILSVISKYNPLYYIVSSGRDLIIKGRLSEPGGFVIFAVFSIFVFVTCLLIFHLTETRIAERV